MNEIKRSFRLVRIDRSCLDKHCISNTIPNYNAARHWLLFNPICYKYIGISCAAIITVAAPNDLFTIGREHGKSIKDITVSYLRKIASIFIDHIKIKRKPSFVFMIGRKDDPFAIRKISRGPVSLPIMRDLL